jgi:hypothetical protein
VNFKLGRSQKSIQSRAALLIQMCINTSMMATIKSLNGFSRERRVVAQVRRGSVSSASVWHEEMLRPSRGHTRATWRVAILSEICSKFGIS